MVNSITWHQALSEGLGCREREFGWAVPVLGTKSAPWVCPSSSSGVPWQHLVLSPTQRCSGSSQLLPCQKFPLDFPSDTWMWMEKESKTRNGVFAQGISCSLLLCPTIFGREKCRYKVVKITFFVSGKFIPPAVLWHSSNQQGNAEVLPYYCWCLLLSYHFNKTVCSVIFTDLYWSFLLLLQTNVWRMHFGGCVFPPPNLELFFNFSPAKLKRKGQRKGWGRSLVISKLKASLRASLRASLGSPEQNCRGVSLSCSQQLKTSKPQPHLGGSCLVPYWYQTGRN